MTWKVVNPMEERVKFVLLASQRCLTMTDLCGEFEISRKTGYKWLKRYEQEGLKGIRERSRRPINSPNRTPAEVVELIVKIRRKRKKLGGKKIRDELKKHYGVDPLPAASTIDNILARKNLSKKRRRRHKKTQPDRSFHTTPKAANDVWGVDFKGWFRTGDKCRCDPLTVSDLHTRYVLCCRIMPQTIDAVKPAFRQLFNRYGLPKAIRVDNGSPFGSRGVCGLTKLSAWWHQQGVRVEFIEPGHPEQNGRHERMHRTLKEDTAKPPAQNLKAQQKRFDRWRKYFNEERAHEALKMLRPADLYEKSTRIYNPNPSRNVYPRNYLTRMVRSDGSIRLNGKLRFIGEALHRMALGLRKCEESNYEVYFGGRLLGSLNANDSGMLRAVLSASQSQKTTAAAGVVQSSSVTHVLV